MLKKMNKECVTDETIDYTEKNDGQTDLFRAKSGVGGFWVKNKSALSQAPPLSAHPNTSKELDRRQ